MAKVRYPLMSGEARGQLGKGMIFRRGGVVTKYFAPRNPNSAAQAAHREAFRSYYMASLTQAQADLLYAVIGHLHDERYSLLEHVHPAPIGETNANDIFGLASPGGVSAFVGTIATLPGGAPNTLTYNVTSGQEGVMVPLATTQLAKMRLYNSTRGTYALISNCNTGTNTLTFTANVPAGWIVGDTITIASSKVSGGTFSWVDLEITSGPIGKSFIFMKLVFNSSTVGERMQTHPFVAGTAASSKYDVVVALVAGQNINSFGLIQVVDGVFSLSWNGTPAYVILREAGYLS